MIYTLISYPGASRTVLPAASSWAGLKATRTDDQLQQITDDRTVRGPEVIITLSVKPALASDGVTLIGVQHTDPGYVTVYAVTRTTPLHADPSGNVMTRFDCSLAATLTAQLNGNSYVRQTWEFDRYLPADSWVNRTKEPIDGAHLLQPLATRSKSYQLLSDYAIVVTWYDVIGSQTTGYDPATIPTTRPRSALFLGLSSTLGVPTIASALTGALAIDSWELVVKAIGSDVNKVYRVQMIPKDVMLMMYSSTGARTGLTWVVSAPFSGSLQYAYFADVERSGVLSGVLSHVPTRPAGLRYAKSAGEPYYKLYIKGEDVATIPAYAPDSEDDSVYTRGGITIDIHASASSGINVYAVGIAESDLPVVRVPLPMPEIQSVGNSLTIWWEGARGSILSTTALGVASIGAAVASGGAALPILSALGSLGLGSLSTLTAGEQAARRVTTVGRGTTDLYATDSTAPLILLVYYGYTASAEVERDRYFAVNGYGGYWAFQLPPVSAEQRPNYFYARGAGRVRLDETSLKLSTVSTPELQAAVTEEISQGIYWWYTAIGNPLGANYPPTS